jgi:protein-S-isoprenylcysteine O-methyltransferase Ste14
MIASRLPLVVLVGSILVFAITGNMFSRSPWAIGAQAVAVGVNLWARRSFARDAFRVEAAPAGSAAIRRGPYAFVRHPMYASALLFLWAGILTHVKVWTVGLGVADSALIIARVVTEERLLRARYADYSDYARTTKALLPFIV